MNAMKPLPTFIVPVLALTIAAQAMAAAGEKPVSSLQRIRGNEIGPLLAGREFTDEVHSAFVFEKGGVLRSFAFGRSGAGTWRVSGQDLCLVRDGDGEHCFEVWVAGSRMELRREPAEPEEGILRQPTGRLAPFRTQRGAP